MLSQAGAARELATAATLVTRVATLWFAVLLGALVLLGGTRAAVRLDDVDADVEKAPRTPAPSPPFPPVG